MPRDMLAAPGDEAESNMLEAVARVMRHELDGLESRMLTRMATSLAPLEEFRARMEREGETCADEILAAVDAAMARHIEASEGRAALDAEQLEMKIGEALATGLARVDALASQTGGLHERLDERLDERLAMLRDGEDGKPGSTGDAGPPGPPGPAGRDGSIAAVRSWRAGEAWAGLHVAYQHRGGLWMAVADPEGAEPGTDDRWRCICNGIADFGIEHEAADPRRMVFAVRQSDGTHSEFAFRMAIPVHRGLWEEDGLYERGDVVARNGASLICVVDLATTPPGESDEWALMSQRGKPGSRGEDGARGIPGPPGPPGKMLGITEITIESNHLVLHRDDGTAAVVPLVNSNPEPPRA